MHILFFEATNVNVKSDMASVIVITVMIAIKLVVLAVIYIMVIIKILAIEVFMAVIWVFLNITPM